MEKHNLLIVSDLHLSEGLNPETAKFSNLEDFLFDDAFARFLRYHEEAKEQPDFGGRPWTLILNGDLLDFLQVVSLPGKGRLLQAVKGLDSPQSLSRNERDYGLGTTAEESEWKLGRIARGHQRFFAALGWFVARGNRVAVVKGNHDVEFYWPQVRERFVKEVKRAYARERLTLDPDLAVAPADLGARIHFYPWFYHEPGRVYVEHGGQYEAVNHFRDYVNPVLPDDPKRIELPWGSLFVRYVLNEVEDEHPFADNVKPASRYLGWAFENDPIGTIELVVARGYLLLRAYWNILLKRASSALRAQRGQGQSQGTTHGSLPPDVTREIEALAKRRVDAVWLEWVGATIRGLLSASMILIITTFLVLAGLTLVEDLSWTTAVYLGAAVLGYFLRRGLKRSFDYILESDYLLGVARELNLILKPDHAVRYLVFGHSHRVAIEKLGKQTWYVNTGAWVPVYAQEGPIEGRETLTFFRLAWGRKGPPELLHWDDAAGAPARVVLREES